MPAPTLNEFLENNIKGYLLRDLESMKQNYAPPPDYLGGCGYPLVGAVCAGVEVLGALISRDPFDTHLGRPYFVNYWETYLYATDPERKATAHGVYSLGRNGVAHTFVMKGPIVVAKGAPSHHFTKAPTGKIVIDAVQLADDFKRSYEIFTRDVDQDARGPTQRLAEMWAVYVEQAYGKSGMRGDMSYFDSLPPCPSWPLEPMLTTQAPWW